MSSRGTRVPPADLDGQGKLELELHQTRQLLSRREFELAELIDEIVYAENEATSAKKAFAGAEANLSALQSCADNLLSYTIRLERDIIAPALGDLAGALRSRDELSATRQGAIAAADRVPPNSRTPVFQKLFAVLIGPSPSIAESLAKRQDVLSGAQNGTPYETEDAFVIADGLIGAKQQLQALLLDSAKRARATGDPGSPNSKSGGTGGGAKAAELEFELQDVKSQLAKARSERDALARKVAEGFNSQATSSVSTSPQFVDLQAQWHAERASLQQRIRALEEAADEQRRDRLDVGNKLDSLNDALMQAHQERTLIEDELHRERQERLSALSQLQRKGTIGGGGFGHMERFGDAEHELRMELDRVVREHSAQVTKMQSEMATLRAEAQTARRDRAFDEAQTAQMEQLKRNNEALRKDIARIQQNVSSSSNRRSGLNGDDGGLALEAKVKSFEATITQLNEELGHVDRRIAEVEQQHQDEKRRLVAAFDAERRQYQLEREECDALVLKMSHEIEFLVRENAFRQQPSPAAAAR